MRLGFRDRIFPKCYRTLPGGDLHKSLFENRQFTSPTDDSYQCEPFAIAAALFKYFGVQNPQVLTGEPAIDESDTVPNELV